MYVRAFAQRKISRGSAEIVEPVPASLEQILNFEFGNLPIVAFGDGRQIHPYPVSLVGPSASCLADLHLGGGVESFAIFFQPLAFSRLFHIPMPSLVNRQYDAYDVLGSEIRGLWHKMAQTSFFTKRVELVEEYLLVKAASSSRNTPIMNAALFMFASNGVARIGDVANQTSLGLRQFERRFLSEIGLLPKLYCRVARFQAALDTKLNCNDLIWLNLAHEFEYHDQAHMIKDFQYFSGWSPESLVQRLGDMRPPALAAGISDSRTRGDHGASIQMAMKEMEDVESLDRLSHQYEPDRNIERGRSLGTPARATRRVA
jgi:hypothetical protein